MVGFLLSDIIEKIYQNVVSRKKQHSKETWAVILVSVSQMEMVLICDTALSAQVAHIEYMAWGWLPLSRNYVFSFVSVLI